MTDIPNNTSENTTGCISEIWRYPVKSLRGESCAESLIDDRGLQFDRRYALVNGDGKFGSHKNTRRFVRMDNLYEMQAVVSNGETSIMFSDGQQMSVTHDETEARVSSTIGQPVSVKPEGDISHQDMGAIHLVSTASLRWLQQHLPGANLGTERFRPNLLIDVAGIGPVEQDWVGRTIRVGTTRLMIVEPTERCVMTTLPVGKLPADPLVLRTLAQHADALFGVYARVVEPGFVRVGDVLS